MQYTVILRRISLVNQHKAGLLVSGQEAHPHVMVKHAVVAVSDPVGRPSTETGPGSD